MYTLPLTPSSDRFLAPGLLRGATSLAVLTLAGCGFLYSLAGVGLGQALFPDAANGSLVQRGGQVVGSALVAQGFSSDRYFQRRPSTAAYDTMAMAGSNQARTNPDLRQRLADTRAAVARRDGVAPTEVPGELVTQSGSGIDPHISPRGATIQVNRIASTRGLHPDAVAALVARHTEPPQFGLFGQPRVNVLQLNLALDQLAGAR